MVDTVPEALNRRYDVQGVLGEGGFATVFSAVDRRSKARVALKLLRPGRDGAYDLGVQRRFRREVQALDKLRSPHTVKLLAHGEIDGVLYAVFEVIDGVELSELLHERGRLDGPEVEHVLRQLLLALREAHRHGVLHRDLKPENIIVTPRGDDALFVKLIDFGIARQLEDGSPSVTRTGELIGTPRYMSPEQLTEAPLTPASDLYSLGMIAFEMALGRDALQGGKWGDQLERLRSGHVFSVRELERVGPRLHQVITRLAARRPEQRFASAQLVLDALDGERAPPAQVVEETERRRGLIVAALFAAVAGALVYIVNEAPETTPSLVTEPPPDPGPLVARPTRADASEPVATRRAIVPWGSDGCTESMLPLPRPATVGMKIYLAGDDSGGPVPLVALLHDRDVSGRQMHERSGFAELAEREGFLLATFDSDPPADPTAGPWTERALGLRSPVVIELVEWVMATRCVDARRVYVVGHGEGGLGAERVACQPLISGVATVSHVPKPPGNACHRRPEIALQGGEFRAIPRVRFVPTQSRHHPVFGERDCGGKKAEVTLNERDAEFADAMGCVARTPEFRRKSNIRDRVWDCPAGVSFESHLVEGGHPWPGVRRTTGEHPCDGAIPDFDYPAAIWEFFESVSVVSDDD